MSSRPGDTPRSGRPSAGHQAVESLGGVALAGSELGSIGAYRMERGGRFGTHRHDSHQLLWAHSGALRVETRTRTWLLSGSAGIWIPPFVDHDVLASRPATLRTLNLEAAWAPERHSEPATVKIDDLARLVVVQLSDDELDTPERANLQAVLFDRLRRAAPGRRSIAIPLDDRARAVALGVLSTPADARSLNEWGRAVGASARTLSRLFVAGTGLTFHDWRRDVRMQLARELLDDGAGVEQTAHHVGYATASAFGVAFRQAFGQAPSHERADR